MDKPTKSVLIVIGSVLLLWAFATTCVVVKGILSFSRFDTFADQGIDGSPQAAARLEQDIADFEVMEGFGSRYDIHFEDVVVIGYKSAGEKFQLQMAQFPQGKSIKLDDMVRFIHDGSIDPDSIWHKTELKLIEQYAVIIGGEVYTFEINVGTTQDGVEHLMVNTKFDGRGGPALVMVATPIDEWNGGMVEAIVESIR